MIHPNDSGQDLPLHLQDVITTTEQRYAFFEELQRFNRENMYKAQRLSEYPPLIDYIDGVVKGDQAQIDDYIAKCQAVKAKYPKPE